MTTDGDLDLHLSQGRLFRPGAKMEEALDKPRHPLPLTDRLYRNDLTAHGVRFTDVTQASGLAATGFGMGAAAGDFDNDGHVDLYVFNHGPNQLWRNDGDGTFTDVTEKAGVGDPGWTTAAVFFDYDRDGDLDLLSVNYVEFSVANHKICQTKAAVETYCSPSLFEPQPDRLYENRGDGTFADATKRLGLDAAFGPGLGAVAADFDGDGWLDLYVANDGEPNQLWLNQQGEGFRDDALLAGAAVSGEGRPEASMGVAAEDFDNDGDVDLFMTHLDGETNTLYVNEGGGTFTDRSVAAGLAMPSQRYTGFGTAWLDGDHGISWWSTARSAPSRSSTGPATTSPTSNATSCSKTWATARTGRSPGRPEPPSSRWRSPAGPSSATWTTTATWTWWSPTTAARLLLNRVGQDQPWVGFRVLTRDGKRDALGARVELLRRGGPPLWRRVRTDGSYASSNDPRVLFGLGDSPRVDGVRVHWPDGSVETFDPVPPGRYTTLRQGTGRKPSEAPAPQDG